MKKYHIKDDGTPSICVAEKRLCTKLKHFPTENDAQKYYESTNKENNIQSILTAPTMLIKKSYIGINIDQKSIEKHLTLWKNKLPEKYKELELNKIKRDGDYSFHMTILSPKEYRILRKEGVEFPQEKIDYKVIGIGKAINDNDEAWFLVCESLRGKAFREKYNLPEKDFHITIGFNNKDVHNKPKDKTSIVFDA